MIPLFPLPNVVLFPDVCLPLHIFEARYRVMIHDVLAHDRIIGIVLMREDPAGREDDLPLVYDVGCSGLITHAEALDDGRFNIVLRGLDKFRILEEDHTRPYRRARVEVIREPAPPADGVRPHRQRLEQILDRTLTALGAGARIPPPCMPDGDLVNTLSQYLEFDAVEKQALLERSGLIERCQSLADLLEMKSMMNRAAPSAPSLQ